MTLILVTDDEKLYQHLLKVNLEKEGYEVITAGNGLDALEVISRRHPDLILLDVMMPKLDGISTCERVRQFSNTPIIILTAKGEEQDRVRGLNAGADDYVVKPFSATELVARVRAVLRRRAPHLAGEAVEVGSLQINPATHRVLAAGQPIDLGPTEFRLLFFFMTHAERVYTRAQLLDEVWGDHVFIEERTVDVHIRRLRAALETSGHHERVETVRGTGYRFRGA